MPELDLYPALAGCFATSTVYALLLSTRRGKQLAIYATWLTVVIGAVILLGWIATQPAHTWEVDAYFLMAGGAPMLIRSWILTGVHAWAYILYVVDNRK